MRRADWSIVIAIVLTAVVAGCGDPYRSNLAIGDCFDVPTTADITTIPTKPCTEPHGGEVFHAFDAQGGSVPHRRAWGPADLPGLRSGLRDLHRDRGRGPTGHRLPLPRADERPLGERRPPRDVLHPVARREPAPPFVPGVLLTFDALAAHWLDRFSTISR
jgi:hypothetical protein